MHTFELQGSIDGELQQTLGTQFITESNVANDRVMHWCGLGSNIHVTPHND